MLHVQLVNIAFSVDTLAEQAGLVLCCLGCAIFGITEVPTDGVEFDSGDQLNDSGEPPMIPVKTQNASQPIVAPYNPPEQPGDTPSANDAGGWDPEKGQPRNNVSAQPARAAAAATFDATIPQKAASAAHARVTESSASKSSPPVDLLDVTSKVTPKADALSGSIHELD